MQSFIFIHALSQGLLLFMLSAGLTLIYGMMGVLNFAHAALYMLGAYIAYAVAQYYGFVAALIVSPCLVGLLGAGMEYFLLRNIRQRAASSTLGQNGQQVQQIAHGAEILMTFGVAYVLNELVHLLWGDISVQIPLPQWLQGYITLDGGLQISRYRIWMMGLVILFLAVCWMSMYIGNWVLIVKAVRDNPDMVSVMGYNVALLWSILFGLGSAFAAFAGVIFSPLSVLDTTSAAQLGSLVFVVVIVGGLGSVKGALGASLVIGFLQTVVTMMDFSIAEALRYADIHTNLWDGMETIKISQIGQILPYVAMIVVLLLRPQGIWGAMHEKRL